MTTKYGNLSQVGSPRSSAQGNSRVRVISLGLGLILLGLGSEDVSRQRLDQNAKFLHHFDPLISVGIVSIFTEFSLSELYIRKEPWCP